MLPIIDLVAAIGGLIIPPAWDFIKKKFIPAEADTPERTASALAATKPEVLAPYIESLVKLKDAGIREYNRDVVAPPSQIIVDIRAGIRPICVILAMTFLFLDAWDTITLAEGVRASFELIISSWFSCRFTMK